MRLKFQSTLKEQYDTQWAINHEAMLLVDFSPNLSSLWSERNWHRVYFIHLMTQSFLLFIYFFPLLLAAVKDSLRSPPMSSWDVGCSQLLLRYSVYFPLSDAFFFSLHWHLRAGEALQLHVSYHCTFCNKFNSVQIWPWGTETLNTKCAL